MPISPQLERWKLVGSLVWNKTGGGTVVPRLRGEILSVIVTWEFICQFKVAKMNAAQENISSTYGSLVAWMEWEPMDDLIVKALGWIGF